MPEKQAEQQFQIGEQLIGQIFKLINTQPYGQVAQLAAELGSTVQEQKKALEQANLAGAGAGNAKEAGEIPLKTG